VPQGLGTRVIRREHWGANLDIIRGEGSCTPILWPAMGATKRSVHLFVLGRRSRTLRLRHQSEAVYYLMEGEARVVDYDEGSSWPLVVGSMFHVEPGTTYAVHTDDVGARILGGPCPPDPAIYLPTLTDAEVTGR
jgi:mannose-6-phosphate isomerase-like protein (cupin superfamily)